MLEDDSVEYEIEMKMVDKGESIEKPIDLYAVDGQIVLFKLKAPKEWEYFLGREYETWKALDDEGNIVLRQEKDQQRITQLKKNGWTAVPADRYPELENFHVDGALKYRGLILLERPKAIGDEARVKLEALNSRQIKFEDLDLIVLAEEDCSSPIQSKIGVSEQQEYFKKQTWIHLVKELFSFFKRKERHYYACTYGSPRSLLFPKTRKLIETVQFKFRFGKYKLDEEEKEVCQSLEISEESYIQEKYKVEISSIY